MMKSTWAALAAAMILAACGGGGDSGEATATPTLATAQLARAKPEACRQDPSAHAMVDGECLEKLQLPSPSVPAMAAAPRAAVPTLTATALFDWARVAFPQFFTGAETNSTSGPFTFRYFAGSGNYVAVASGGVYVLGPMSAWRILYVGELAEFTCLVYTCGPVDTVPGDSSTSANVTVGGSVTGTIDTAGDADWYRVFLQAGTTYTFDLQGAYSGQGTLDDPILRLLNSGGSQVAYDDDGRGGYEARITYTATSTAWHFLSAQAYQTDTGTFRLSVAGGTGGGGGGGGGGTVDWNSSMSATEIVQFNETLAVNARAGQGFSITGGTMDVELIFASQYSADVYITDGASISACVNGNAFQYYTSYSMQGQFGFKAFSLPPGEYGVCVANKSNSTNAVRVEFQEQPTVVGFAYNGLRFNTVAQNVSAGSRFVQPVTIGNTYRVVIDGANSGGTFYIIPADQQAAFLAGNTFQYYTDIDCGSGRAAPGLCELTGVGTNAAIAYENDTGATQSIVIIGRDYVPQ
ncbi:MAG: PPC domain-containing protein [Burkholderiales bacterium]|nr:PPC domain-containing protein [Burkholderiales bacterium]